MHLMFSLLVGVMWFKKLFKMTFSFMYFYFYVFEFSYTPSLRELRSLALVLQMPYAKEDRLVKRLQEVTVILRKEAFCLSGQQLLILSFQIAQLEDVLIDSSALFVLVSICGLDFRSCLNGLQYLAARFLSAVIDSQTVMKVKQ